MIFAFHVTKSSIKSNFTKFLSNLIVKSKISFITILWIFFIDYNKIRWIICWLNNKIQMSYMTIFYFKKTFEIIKFFKFFFNIIKHDFNRCIRIRIDNNFEFINDKFVIFRNKRYIRIQFFIVKNFQMNNCVERFNQNFMRKINIFQKNFELTLK